jgi:hypothetical protein
MQSSESKRRASGGALVRVLAAGVVLLSCGDARAQSAPPPSSPAPSSGASTWMSVGATTFAATYVAAALTATTDYYTDAATSSKRTDLWVPVFGPLDQIGKTKSAGLDVLLVLDSLAELGGLTIFGYGVAESMSRPAAATPNAAAAATWPVLHLAALPVGGGAGAAVAAAF